MKRFVAISLLCLFALQTGVANAGPIAKTRPTLTEGATALALESDSLAALFLYAGEEDAFVELVQLIAICAGVYYVLILPNSM